MSNGAIHDFKSWNPHQPGERGLGRRAVTQGCLSWNQREGNGGAGKKGRLGTGWRVSIVSPTPLHHPTRLTKPKASFAQNLHVLQKGTLDLHPPPPHPPLLQAHINQNPTSVFRCHSLVGRI